MEQTFNMWTRKYTLSGILGTANWKSKDSYLWAGTPIFHGNLSKSLNGTATFSGNAFCKSYFEVSSEIPGLCSFL